MCVAGAVVAASGLLAASFSSSLAWLLATYSCVTGVGFGQYRMVTVCRLFRIVTMERLYMEAQDGLKTIAPPLFLNIFFYFLLV